jgi:hypothetical protein
MRKHFHGRLHSSLISMVWPCVSGCACQWELHAQLVMLVQTHMIRTLNRPITASMGKKSCQGVFGHVLSSLSGCAFWAVLLFVYCPAYMARHARLITLAENTMLYKISMVKKACQCMFGVVCLSVHVEL